MAIQQRRQPTSIYLTFKVIQLVNQLRRRLKPRVSGSTHPSLLGTETSLGLESKAVKTIVKGLSRVGLQERKQLHHASNRICKSRKNSKASLKHQTPGRQNSANPNTPGEEVQHVLKSLDGNIRPPDKALSAMAADHKLFLKQSDTFSLEPCSLNETIRCLVLVHDAINVLYAARSQYDDGWLIAQGNEIGLSIDESFIANYEHLLLRLQAQLIDVLTRKVVEAMIENRGDKKKRKLLNWFTEFPDNRHPLNTTWPWSIKPSLAVLWGVCWMFYNSPGQQNIAEEGNHRVPQARFLQNEEFRGWPAPQPNEYINLGLELTGTQSQPAVQQQASRDRAGVSGGVHLRFPNVLPTGTNSADGWNTNYLSRQASARPDRASRAASSFGFASDGLDLRPGSGPIAARGLDSDFLSPRSTRTYYQPSLASRTSHSHDNNFSSPNLSGIATAQTIFAFPQHQQQLDSNRHNESWLPFPQSLPQTPASHLTNPTIRVTDGGADSEGLAPPQQDFASFDIYQPSPQQPQAPQLNVNTNIPNFALSSYTMGNCSLPETSPILTTGPRHERTSSINSNSNIPTPVSMSGPLSPSIGGRRPSIAHSIASSMGRMRQRSEDNSSQDGDDTESPRRNHAYKRSEEPPRNHDGKMVCKHTECVNITFDRKCEWSKHMDKHDRPYKCNVKGCEKLQGFTYSGGLLRHEREVHKMHGGTKKSLFCPFPDCKRSSGSGFTRKENLAEHIRRVHRRTSTSSDLGNLVILRPDTQDDSTTEVRLPSESPYQRIVEVREEDEVHLSTKRKRTSDAGLSEEGDETDLRAEVKRLRQENEEKDARLRQLEAAVMALQQGRR